jgi:hypothetical protein
MDKQNVTTNNPNMQGKTTQNYDQQDGGHGSKGQGREAKGTRMERENVG